MSVTSVSPVLTIDAYQPQATNERSISTWKTTCYDSNWEKLVGIKDAMYVQINSEEYKEYVGNIYKIVRFEFRGQKVIYNIEKTYLKPTDDPHKVTT